MNNKKSSAVVKLIKEEVERIRDTLQLPRIYTNIKTIIESYKPEIPLIPTSAVYAFDQTYANDICFFILQELTNTCYSPTQNVICRNRSLLTEAMKLLLSQNRDDGTFTVSEMDQVCIPVVI